VATPVGFKLQQVMFPSDMGSSCSRQSEAYQQPQLEAYEADGCN
jgi:hypothetical protein